MGTHEYTLKLLHFQLLPLMQLWISMIGLLMLVHHTCGGGFCKFNSNVWEVGVGNKNRAFWHGIKCLHSYSTWRNRRVCATSWRCAFDLIASNHVNLYYKRHIDTVGYRYDAVQYITLLHTVYPKKYAHGFCFAVLCCGYTLTDFPISIRLTSLALWQSNDCPSTSKATLMNMDKYFMWIHYERLRNHNKAKHNKTVCIFLGIYCTVLPWQHQNINQTLNSQNTLGLYSLSGKTSYRKISWSLEAARFGFKHFQSLWNLTGTSAAVLPRCLWNFRAILSL